MYAQKETSELGASSVSTEHILLGLIALPGSQAFLGTSLNLEKARRVVVELMGRHQRKVHQQDLPFSADAKRVYEAAATESKRSGHHFIGPEHILIAVLSIGDVGARTVVQRLGVDAEAVKNTASKKLRGEQEDEGRKIKAATAASGDREGSKALSEFCRDLCEEARQARADPVIGRETEVARVTQILARRLKNNPILLGEPGVGKTAIAEGLATAIVNGKQADGAPLPDFLKGKRILQLDVGLLIAGAKERGELELRVSKILAEVKQEGNVILMIDEIHTLVGSGAVGRGGGGGLDISNLLKPALSRGELQCIGATTLDEHRKYLEKDTALERRFQPVYVGEPTQEQAVTILEGLKDRYERHHRCIYEPAALQAAVRLSTRYVADRHLPDKAIDLIDEAGSRARIGAYLARKAPEVGSREEAGDLRDSPWESLQQVLEAKEEAVRDELFEEAQLLREHEVELKDRLMGPADEGAQVPCVGEADIEHIVSSWTGIPVDRMSQDDKTRLLNLAAVLKERVIGQDAAVEAVARSVQRAQSGLKNPQRPIASMLFSGPTGVGKTELARVLSDHYFGSVDSMIRLDMSEYMERHTVSKLVGAPPGYVGFGEGGKLTEAVRRRPFCVVLFDEIEKAHPDVFNILLQIMEDGRLTDSQGRTVSFKNTLIIMTSNVGSSVIAKGGSSLGFALPTDEDDGGNYSRIKTLVMEELKAYFRPEMLNRMDEVVVFRQLGQAEVRHIADLVIAETAARLAARNMTLELAPAVMAKICEEGYEPAYGARPLKRAVTRLVDDALSDALLFEKIKDGDLAYMDCNAEGKIVVTAGKPEPHQPEPEPALPSTILKSEIVLSPLGKGGIRSKLSKKASVNVNA
ncbi:hypothetical protein WJX72_011733 [[Myrmecia] bisecta]|uniref:Clp R domain-containing protein n=1 Tax=[Myrmecia] bisecta TaxID=41462 RepID=A0AAW1R9E6_9CHLO